MSKKKKVETKSTLNFIITTTAKEELVIETKSYDWKLTLAPHTRHHQLLNHYISSNTVEELNVILDWVYVVNTTMLIDRSLNSHITSFFKERLENAVPDDVSEDEDKEILKDLENDGKTTSDSE